MGNFFLFSRSSLKVFIEFYAVVPLLLVALAGTYHFGYFDCFNALWILPSLPVQTLLYSILINTLLFSAGNVLSLLYLNSASVLGHTFVLVFLGIITGCFIIFMGFQNFIDFLLKLIPLYLGVFYYFYVHHAIFGNELERYLFSPVALFLSLMLFLLMYGRGVADAHTDMNDNKLPVVIFDQQKLYPNETTDWRLLKAIDNRFVLINLKNHLKDHGFEIKVVEYNKVDSIY